MAYRLALAAKAQIARRRTAIPTLLERLLGDDDPHPVGRRKQVLILGGGQFVGLGGLDGDFGFVQPGGEQPVLGVEGVNVAAFPLFLAGAFHLHQQDGAAIAAPFAMQASRCGVQHVQAVESGAQGVAPVGALAGVEILGQVDHALVVEFGTQHFDQDVGVAGLAWGSRRSWPLRLSAWR